MCCRSWKITGCAGPIDGHKPGAAEPRRRGASRAFREIGLVHETMSSSTLGTALEAIIQALLQGAPGAQADAKSLVFLNDATPLDEALRAETVRRNADRRATDEAKEGLAAFLEKRKPGWRKN
jgi:methylglutaconyl-CoA hydratase